MKCKQKKFKKTIGCYFLFLGIFFFWFEKTAGVYFKETFENYNLGESRNIGKLCDPPNLTWVPMMSSAWVNTAVTNLVKARHGEKYMRVWGTVPEGMCNEKPGVVSGIDEIFKGGGTFRGFNSQAKPCHAMEWGWEYWIGFSYFIPANYFPEYTRGMIFQLKDTAEQGHPCMSLNSFSESDDWYFIVFQLESGALPNINWTSLRGTWVDIVIHTVPAYRDKPNPKSVLELYINGKQFILRGPNEATCRSFDPATQITQPTSKQYFTPIMYNTAWATQVDGVYTALPENVAKCKQCNETVVGSPTPEFTRENNYDEFIIVEDNVLGVHDYCDVAPPIWGASPVISSPGNNSINVGTNPTVQYSAYADHREDPQNCFTRSSTQIQVDEQGGDWSSLVYESLSAGATSHILNGLISGRSYQVRVRHKSIRSGNNDIYEGDWSPVINFKTGTSLLGDLNNDGKVDIADYSMFIQDFGKTGANLAADLNKNGQVEIGDYSIFISNFGKSN